MGHRTDHIGRREAPGAKQVAGAVPTRPSIPASWMQQLQRSIGNRAVAGLVESATARAETKRPVAESSDRANAEAVSRRPGDELNASDRVKGIAMLNRF